MTTSICSCGHGITDHWGLGDNASACHGWIETSTPCSCLEFNSEYVPSEERRRIIREYVENAWTVYSIQTGSEDEACRECFEAGLFTAFLNIKNSLSLVESYHRFWVEDHGWVIPAVQVAQLRDSIIDGSDGKIA